MVALSLSLGCRLTNATFSNRIFCCLIKTINLKERNHFPGESVILSTSTQFAVLLSINQEAQLKFDEHEGVRRTDFIRVPAEK